MHTTGKSGDRSGQRWTAEVAAEILAEQEASGESIAGFARRRGVSVQRLHWWRKRLRDWSAAATKSEATLVPAVIEGGDRPAVKLRVGELEMEIAQAEAVRPEWVAGLLRALGAGR